MMEPIDWESKESCSVFTALLMSSPVVRLAGLKTSRLAQVRSYVVVNFWGMGEMRRARLGMRRRKKRDRVCALRKRHQRPYIHLGR